VAGFLQDWTDWILALEPAVVGFTSQFHQHTAALALARRLKARRPDLFLVGGGPNFRGPMGREAVVRFPFLDAAVSGEGDLVLPMLVDRVLSGQTVADLPGVFTPGTPEGPVPAEYAPVPEHLDDLPDPDTSDFDQAWAASSLASDHTPRYLLETSRGCWWGARSRCLFCGQASARLDYRSKSAVRAAHAFTALGRAHPDAPLIVTDEIINPAFFRSLLPELAHSGLGARIVYFEVRPDLDKTQLRALREAGTLRVEAGIESLSTPVLHLIRKGVTALQCLQFLKWCRELGLTPVWNWLWGFPGEPPGEYQRLARNLARVFHLAPPNYAGPFRLDRFSPYFEHPREHGLEAIAPYPAYRHVYPFPDKALDRLAYYFTCRTAAPGREVDANLELLSERIDRWKAVHPRASLAFVDEGDRLVLRDHRDPDREAAFTALDGPHRRLYLACDRIRSATQLDRLLHPEGGAAPTAEPLKDLLAPMVEQGWMAQEGDRYLALAVPSSPTSGACRQL
jgi:ribosomal peptide maturation radical SAM protein 1